MKKTPKTERKKKRKKKKEKKKKRKMWLNTRVLKKRDWHYR